MRELIQKIEFGDFQTPLELAEECINVISKYYLPKHVIEPTCGIGNFLEASYSKWGNNSSYVGCEINSSYVEFFKKRCPKISKKIKLINENFFTLNLEKIFLNKNNPLVVGNPPWVTNSQLGVLESNNLPKKSNIKNLSGFEALSGKSNFDISEWIILKLSEKILNTSGVLAMLCKTTVARNIFLQNYNMGFKDVGYKIFKINSKKYFNVSVDACLFIIDCFNGGNEKICKVYANLKSKKVANKIGISKNKIISNLELYISTKNIVSGSSKRIWRSGIKHDASKVMELKRVNGNYINGFNEVVKLEEEYVYPLLKSSDLANERLNIERYIIITQKKINEDTSYIEKKAPFLWSYLEKYSYKLDNRKSSIYKNSPRFSIFGVGEYSFKPYKIAVSGLYKKVNFCLLKPFNGKPVIVDDTCYLLGFDNLKSAKKALNILRSNIVSRYVSSLVFLDSKRPIKSDILQSINFEKVELFIDNLV